MGVPVTSEKADQLAGEETSGEGQLPLLTTMDAGGWFELAESDSFGVLGAGAAAKSVRFSRLERHDRILQREGFGRVNVSGLGAISIW